MRLKKTIALLCSAWFFICICLFHSSATMINDNQSKSIYISATDASISVDTYLTTVEGYVKGTSDVVRVRIILELQKKTGESYSTIKTWEKTYNAYRATMQKSKLTSPLNTYRLKATFTAYTNTSSETKIVYAYDNK